MTIDDELNRAADDLRRELRSINPPPLPGSTPNRSRTVGSRVVLVGAVLAVFGVGGALIVNADRGDEIDATGTATVETALADESTSTSTSATASSSTSIEDDVADAPSTQDEITAIDATFGTSLTILNSPGGPGSAVLPLPGGSPALNADESLLLLYEVGIEPGGHVIYDAATLGRIGPVEVEPFDIEQVYWDPVDPNRLYSVTGDQLMATDVSGDSSTVIHRFEGCDIVQTTGVAQPISADGRWFGAICEQGSTAELVALELATGREIRRATTLGSIGPAPVPDGTGFVSQSADGVVQVLDEELEPTDVTFTVGTDLFALVRTSDGRQLFVTTVFEQPAEAIGSVVGFDLATGAATVAIGEAAGDPYPPSGTLLAGSVTGTAQVVVTIAGDAALADDPDTLDGKVLLVDFDQFEPMVTPIAGHGAARSASTLDPFWVQSHPAVAAGGTTVLYAADPGDGRITVVVAQAPAGGSS